MKQAALVFAVLLALALAPAPALAECPPEPPPYDELCDGGPARTRRQGCHDLLRWAPAEGSNGVYEVQRRAWRFPPIWSTVAIVSDGGWLGSVAQLCRYETPEGIRLYWLDYEGEERPPRPGTSKRYRVRTGNMAGDSDWTRKVVRWVPE